MGGQSKIWVESSKRSFCHRELNQRPLTAKPLLSKLMIHWVIQFGDPKLQIMTVFILY